MVRIESCSFERGRSVMRSHAIVSNGHTLDLTVIGYVGTFGFIVFDFVSWHLGHPFMYCMMNFFMSGHQYSCSMAKSVFEIPGCPAVTWSW